MWKLSGLNFSIKPTYYGKSKKNDRKVLFIVNNGLEIMSIKLLKISLFFWFQLTIDHIMNRTYIFEPVKRRLIQVNCLLNRRYKFKYDIVVNIIRYKDGLIRGRGIHVSYPLILKKGDHLLLKRTQICFYI